MAYHKFKDGERASIWCRPWGFSDMSSFPSCKRRLQGAIKAGKSINTPCTKRIGHLSIGWKLKKKQSMAQSSDCWKIRRKPKKNCIMDISKPSSSSALLLGMANIYHISMNNNHSKETTQTTILGPAERTEKKSRVLGSAHQIIVIYRIENWIRLAHRVCIIWFAAFQSSFWLLLFRFVVVICRHKKRDV